MDCLLSRSEASEAKGCYCRHQAVCRLWDSTKWLDCRRWGNAERFAEVVLPDVVIGLINKTIAIAITLLEWVYGVAKVITPDGIVSRGGD